MDEQANIDYSQPPKKLNEQLLESLPKEGLKIRTLEERKEENKKNERQTGVLIRLFRVIRDNPDLIILFVLISFVFVAGYYLCRIYLGMSMDQIKIHVSDFIAFVVTIVGGAIALIGKLYVPQGVISKQLSEKADKESDLTGKSIIR